MGLFDWFKTKNKNKQSSKPTKCNHKWHQTSVVREEKIIIVNGYKKLMPVEYTYLFCPRCEKRLKVTSQEAHIILKEQKLKEEYTEQIEEEFRGI